MLALPADSTHQCYANVVLAVVQQNFTCASKPLMAVTGTCLASRG